MELPPGIQRVRGGRERQYHLFQKIMFLKVENGLPQAIFCAEYSPSRGREIFSHPGGVRGIRHILGGVIGVVGAEYVKK